jgi:peptide-methionine (R)-S-oxide reductase
MHHRLSGRPAREVAATVLLFALAVSGTTPSRRPTPKLSRASVVRNGVGAALAAVLAPAARASSAEPLVSAAELAQWRAKLPVAQYRIMFGRGTEPPFSSALVKEKRLGTYACGACGVPLFASATKFDSGTGWPSFYAALDGVQPVSDNMAIWALLGTEVHCKSCRAHLGDLFADGYIWSTPTNLRYCIDGLSLAFRPDASDSPAVLRLG